MQIGPRYKKARYLGVPIFPKTQTQKYSMRLQRKSKTTARKGAKSEYGKQMMEKQKARFSYGISGRQFTNYVKKALKSSGDNGKNLLSILESRLDNVVVRAGFALSHSAGRQMVSHGHIMVNGVIVTVPSYQVKIGDTLTIREGSKSKGLFAKLDEQLKGLKHPNWLSVDEKTKTIKIIGKPTNDSTELLFDVGAVLEFYTR